MSYRNRGKEDRKNKKIIIKNKKIKKLNLIKKILRKIEKKIIFAYSAIKIKANLNPPYSTLNPETNSDSPSAKSKGARFVSAIQQTKQITNKKKESNDNMLRLIVCTTPLKSKEKNNKVTLNKTKTKGSS